MYKLTDKMILKAIKGSNGIISTIAKRVKCDWHTVNDYINLKGKEDIKQAFDNEKESLLDMSEKVISDAIKKKDVDAAKWYLSKIGRKRGFGEKVDITSNGESINKIEVEIITKAPNV